MAKLQRDGVMDEATDSIMIQLGERSHYTSNDEELWS
jgi:hypothetical protein